MSMKRRDFLKASLGSMAYFSAAATVPAWVAKSAHALTDLIANDRILVIVQQAGGNDGLNTVIPYTDPFYTGDMWRPNLHITSGFDNTIIDSFNALHPSMIRLKDWWDNGNMAVLQNVGYPNPSLSHFVSTDYWEYGTSPGSQIGATLEGTKGWVGRYFDNACAGIPTEEIDPIAMAATGHFSVPKALAGSERYTPPAILDFDFYKIPYPGTDDQPGSYFYEYGQIIQTYAEIVGNLSTLNPEGDFLQRVYNLATASIADVATASELEPLPGITYPRGQLGDGLDMASRMIRAGLGTRIFYVSQGGYDTHANQFLANDPVAQGDHPRLLGTFDESLDAFLQEMDASGNLDRVLVMTFSEFGRRVGENGSSGTDHGAGNCLFVLGGAVNKGVYGGQPQIDPDTVNANNGNLGHEVDFRSVYGRVIRDWLGGDPESIYGTADWENFGIGEGVDAIPFINAAEPAGPEDVNGDGVVNSADIQTTINAVLGMDVGGANADVNEDGQVNSADIQTVINTVLGASKNGMPAEAVRSLQRNR